MSTVKEKVNFAVGFVKANPVFVLYLGICSTLAISTTINNALGMGICVTIVLLLSNVIVSLLRNITPDEIHIPVYILVIATLVTIVGMLLQAYTPELYTALGSFIDLIVVNCIILGRAEAYASTHSIGESAMDGLSMGLGYTFSLLLMSVIRQILGTGALALSNPFNGAVLFDVQLIPEGFQIPFFNSIPGAFLTFAILAAVFSVWKKHLESKDTKKEVAE